MIPVLWLILLPFGGAFVVYWLRRSTIGAILSIVIASLSAWITLWLPGGTIATLLGRTIELDQLSQITLALVFGAGAVLFLLSIPLVREENKGQIFYPVGLVVLGLFTVATLSRHLGITVIFVEIAVILTVFIIQGKRLESTRATRRFLTLTSLATPLLLFAAWRIDQYQLEGVQSDAVLKQTALFVALGFSLWLALFPFHGWLTAITAESSPIAAAFVLITFPVVIFSVLMHLLIDTPWLTHSTPLAQAIIIVGIFTAFLGGILATIQPSFGRLMGYAALYDLGCTLVVLGIGGPPALVTILTGLTARVLALLLIAAGMSSIRLLVDNDSFSQVKGLAERIPVATTALVIGGLTLAGVPLTAGFAPRWQLFQTIATVDSRLPVLLFLAGLGVVVGYLRGGKALLPDRQKVTFTAVQEEPYLLLIIITILGLASLLLGLFPHLLIEPLQRLVLSIPAPIR